MNWLILTCALTALCLVSVGACLKMARSHAALTTKAVVRNLELSFNRRELRATENQEAQHEAFQSLRRDFANLSEDCSNFLENAGTKLRKATARSQREGVGPVFGSPNPAPAPPPDPHAAEKAWEEQKRRRILGAVK